MASAAHSVSIGQSQFRVTKRAKPTMTAYAPVTGTAGSWYDAIAAADIGASLDQVGFNNARMYGAVGSSSSIQIRGQWVAESQIV